MNSSNKAESKYHEVPRAMSPGAFLSIKVHFVHLDPHPSLWKYMLLFTNRERLHFPSCMRLHNNEHTLLLLEATRLNT
ncbi:hypothetical protein D3C74_03480 [compost metagenome]